MARAIIVYDDVVINVVEYDTDLPKINGAEVLPAPDGVGIGHTRTAPDTYEAPARVEAEPVVPPFLTARQLRLWLLGAGLLDQVAPALDALSEPDKSAALIEWEYSTEYSRQHPLVSQIGSAFGLTSDEIDRAFISASAL